MFKEILEGAKIAFKSSTYKADIKKELGDISENEAVELFPEILGWKFDGRYFFKGFLVATDTNEYNFIKVGDRLKIDTADSDQTNMVYKGNLQGVPIGVISKFGSDLELLNYLIISDSNSFGIVRSKEQILKGNFLTLYIHVFVNISEVFLLKYFEKVRKQ